MAKVRPSHYSIRLEPNFENFYFSGLTEISIRATEPIDKIELNAHELAVWKCQVKKEKKFIECQFSFNPKKQILSIDLPEVKSDLVLKIEYMGLINDKLVGLYRSKYIENKEEKFIAVTQFEEDHARQAFPCFDHPSMKATFDIEFIIDKKFSGIANTRVEEETDLKNDKKLIKFKITPKMSSYLLSLVSEILSILKHPRKLYDIELPLLLEKHNLLTMRWISVEKVSNLGKSILVSNSPLTSWIKSQYLILLLEQWKIMLLLHIERIFFLYILESHQKRELRELQK